MSREELSAFLDVLREEEAGHLARLQSLLYGVEADRSVVATWRRRGGRAVPTGTAH